MGKVKSVGISTSVKSDEVKSLVSSKNSAIEYYPKVIITSSFAPQIMIEGVTIDEIDV